MLHDDDDDDDEWICMARHKESSDALSISQTSYRHLKGLKMSSCMHHFAKR